MDRSIIQQKREELRQLVGSKYLDMLQVSETISSMNEELSNISSSVNTILSVFVGTCCNAQECNSVNNEYVYCEEVDENKRDTAIITPERLWELYDNKEMFQLAKELIQFREQRKII